jgi:hypothetical protein
VLFRTAPIIDLRPDLAAHRQLPAELGTLALWGGWALLLAGPVAPLSGMALLGLWRLRRRWQGMAPAKAAGPTQPLEGSAPPTAAAKATAAGPLIQSSADLGRAAMAHAFGLREVDLFRAQHAPVCTVHHDDHGRILLLECPPGPLEGALHDRDAHLVG